MGKKLILVGCGKIGYALLAGWVRLKKVPLEDIYVVQPSEAGRQRAATLGVQVFAQPEDLPKFSEAVIFLAVKPQKISEMLGQYRGFVDRSVFVTVITGIPEKAYQGILGNNLQLIRCIPNTPSAIGEGVLGLWFNEKVTEDDLAFVKNFLSANGVIVPVAREELLDSITAVSGSGSAYIFYLLEVMTELAIEFGLDPREAYSLAQQTIGGAVLLSKQSTQTAAQLRDQVTSPNGTTAAALKILMQEEGLKKLLRETMQAAFDRSAEIGQEMVQTVST